MTEIADRKQAIYQALRSAVRGDTVLITGMGHEQYRIDKWQANSVERQEGRSGNYF